MAKLNFYLVVDFLPFKHSILDITMKHWGVHVMLLPVKFDKIVLGTALWYMWISQRNQAPLGLLTLYRVS
jgi:hypothetical protein